MKLCVAHRVVELRPLGRAKLDDVLGPIPERVCPDPLPGPPWSDELLERRQEPCLLARVLFLPPVVLVVTPLISLAEDQTDKLERWRIAARRADLDAQGADGSAR